MDEQDKILNESAAEGIQMHEIKPTTEGMSFGALLDKFYLNSVLMKGIEESAEKGSETKAQDFVTTTKTKASNRNKAI